uniref:UvrD-like helicase C-terminal domain-containing protein n=1 Tax=Candidatus Kentrum sp. TUN TaxID=2126343 RepID=A0A450ZBH1_9GAMM|nr:MAG: UvrD-like helicase C-terminal domain-containing protein [Candidatus Kentron sp. TUN]VFK51155.1 MAG: UvrD-like helicase C-terminal domain-containing protein [Candidatus Kentron sp. TUN]
MVKIQHAKFPVHNSTNPGLQLANDFVQYTDHNLFLTGKAGTGKTTFLHALKNKTSKRMIVTAPTGVAAINAGGVTLHSFFQIPFGPFVPGSEAHKRNHYRFSKEKKRIINNLDLLVIDEISMVRADLLDGVDAALRRYRRNQLPFGGVQLLMIGDLHQLSPVAKENEWNILRQHYSSPYFFNSNALGQSGLVPIELTHIYRQSDTHFIEILNRVRENRLDSSTWKVLNKRYIPDFTPGDTNYITLTTHNSNAECINDAELQALSGKLHTFRADIEGDFPEYAYPTLATLGLKIGAQVMFVRNDPSPEKRYFNGKIGEVTRIRGENIRVKCPGDDLAVVVEKTTWQNITYKVDSDTGEIQEDTIGKFVQYPLKPAWAITIHKSQGLTFDRAIIDANAAFAHGQVYVALSRCRTLEGIVLRSPLSPGSVKTDSTVSHFVEGIARNPPSQEGLKNAKINYQQRLLRECFDFRYLGVCLNRIVGILVGNEQTITVSGIEDIRESKRIVEEEIIAVGVRFERQLTRLFANNTLPESDAAISERVTKASGYFRDKLDTTVVALLRDIRVNTRNKELRKRMKRALDQTEEETTRKLAAVNAGKNGFSVARYLRAVSVAKAEEIEE